MKKRSPKTDSFKELEAKWYEKLKKDGFVDIENTTDPARPLKLYHSHQFKRERTVSKMVAREKYNRQIDDFINHKRIHEICKHIAGHGNSTVKPKTVLKILELHSGGLTERAIAKKTRRGKKCVHLTLKKAREWMKVA